MTVQAVEDEAEFGRLADPYRRELLAFCYSMLGSVEDAEDLVQETYLRAWRSYGGFEGRSSLRSWLYRIATNRCLTALERRGRRPLPSGLAGPADPDAPLVGAGPEIAWLQPFPDPPSTAPADPAVIVAGRDSVRLALVAAMQHLSARQRAVLILREVLAWRAAEVAEVLDMTTTAVNSALQHARARLGRAAAVEDELTEPPEADRRALLARYVRAFEDADVAGLVALLHEDAVMEMPPYLSWFAGRAAVIGFLKRRCLRAPGDFLLVPVVANGQPAAGAYLRGADGVHRAHGIQVLTVRTTGITRIDTFLEPGLFAAFGLPATYPESCRLQR
ncbi:MAG TPA: sigma-70 family RNA polymerase sigma factor [Actinoallomurus sp.]|nr:sigma-70 family RNA polymerase sigma factor [Actinoallomurus sp.]